MTTLAIRKKLVDYMQVIDEKKLKAIYALVENEIDEAKNIDFEQYNSQLAEAEAEYQNGEYVSLDEMKNIVKKW